MTDFSEKSYKKHKAHFENDLASDDRKNIHETWFRKDTADYWRNDRKYEIADILGADKDAHWLTIGDGRYGLDAIRLKEKGISNVVPSDICGALLDIAMDKKLISEYYAENAEKLSFENNTFDYVFCKESYHHFPRPMIALYEMLRVARKAVVLIEPCDNRYASISNVIYFMMNLIGKKKHFNEGAYEDSGNYVYTISKREIEKVALGLNYPAVAFKGQNDHYIKGCEFQPSSWSSSAYRKIRISVFLKDLMSRFSLTRPNILMAVIFKTPLDAGIDVSLKDSGWQVVRLPANPNM
jgi:ubiquinone/menaquinone biosynthesis C-methylase UbiE